MRFLQILVATGLTAFALQAYAVDCSGIDKKSNAYQTCKLRQENEDRDTRLQSTERLRQEMEAKEANKNDMEVFKDQFANEMALLKLFNAEGSRMSRLGADDSPPSCVQVMTPARTYALILCKAPVLILGAGNSTDLVQEFGSALQGNRLEAFYVGGLNMLTKSESTAVYPQKTGVAIYVDLRDSSDVFEELKKKIASKRPIEIFLKSDRQSIKFVLNVYK